MTLVAGVDSSTQATKVVVRDASTGEVLREGRAGHPDGTELDPDIWWRAFLEATRGGLLDGVAAIGVGAQQHGMVLLDAEGSAVRPALLWNDTRSARAAADLVDELGGPQEWAEAVGTVPVASITVTKLRWVAEHEPEAAARANAVLLPHDYLTWLLAGGGGRAVTDRGDASGTGYWSPAEGRYRLDLVKLAFGRELRVPEVIDPQAAAGESADGMVVAAGTGDNMAAALGVEAERGDVIVSIGTSGTVFAVHDHATADASGIVAGFADASGRFLPLVCTLNAAQILSATATMLGVDSARLDDLALSAPARAEGVVLLPYFSGERTPNRPDATGVVAGLTLRNATPANLARAAVEGVLCGLADGLDALARVGISARRLLLVGGGARSRAVQAVAGTVFDCPVEVPAPREFVALGAARQAAWALSGESEPPQWGRHGESVTVAMNPVPGLREAYGQLRDNQP